MNNTHCNVPSMRFRWQRFAACGASLLFGIAAIVGCGSGNGKSSPATPTTLSGTWSGVLGQDLLTLNLGQNGTVLTGDATYTTDRSVTGSINGSATLPNFSCSVDFPVSVGGMTITGKLVGSVLKIHAQQHRLDGSISTEADGRLDYVPPTPPPSTDNSGGG